MKSTLCFICAAVLPLVWTVTDCSSDSDCDSSECCLLSGSDSALYNYCVPQVFCNKKVSGDSCMDPKECYSDCCVGMTCRSEDFCFERYITPIVNGASFTMLLLVACIASCCYACRLSHRQRRLEQEADLIKYRLTLMLQSSMARNNPQAAAAIPQSPAAAAQREPPEQKTDAQLQLSASPQNLMHQSSSAQLQPP